MKKYNHILLLVLFSATLMQAQKGIIEGYTFENENRGFLQQVEVGAYSSSWSKDPIATTFSDEEGHFSLAVPANQSIFLKAKKALFHDQSLDTLAPAEGEKLFVKIKMYREPGYLFDVLLVEATDDPKAPMESIKGARIEIFNNTTDKEELVLKDYEDSEFNFTFKRGNHYTIMIRKEGYLTKRMEVYVNVKGCILCFEGIGTIEPNVSDNINSDQEHGSLLSTVLMRRATVGSTFKIQNIHYDYNKAYIRPDAAVELDKVVRMLKDNPTLNIELGSHTDSRGKDAYNMKLSQKRAEAAVAYIIKQGIDAHRITAKGYGESKIINRCINGVKCSDKEHEENRRTEITILGFNQTDGQSFKPLSQIIREEKFLRNVLEGKPEVVEYKEGDEMPDDLKKFLEEKARTNGKEVKDIDKVVKEVRSTPPVVLSSIPDSARVPQDFTGYLIYLESKDKLLSPSDQRYKGLKQVFVIKNKHKNQWDYFTGPFQLYSEAKRFNSQLLRNSVFKKTSLKLFKNGKENK